MNHRIVISIVVISVTVIVGLCLYWSDLGWLLPVVGLGPLTLWSSRREGRYEAAPLAEAIKPVDHALEALLESEKSDLAAKAALEDAREEVRIVFETATPEDLTQLGNDLLGGKS